MSLPIKNPKLLLKKIALGNGLVARMEVDFDVIFADLNLR